jgi:flagellar biosynthetic protein FlhB
MAEEDDTEKTLEPSQKRLQEAVERGDVVKSQEVSTWFLMAGATLIVMAFSGKMSNGVLVTMRGLIANSYDISVDGPGFIGVLARLLRELILAVGLPLALLVLAALAGTLIQHPLVWSTEALQPKLSKISPAAGLERLFSVQTLANFGKGLAKLSLLGIIIGALLWPERFRLEGLVTLDPAAMLPLTHTLAVKVLGTVVAVLALIAALDYFFQYRQWYERQKMSVAELKEEYKQTDGDPAIKGKIKQIRQSRARKRMMAAVKTASVVITNPTHYAVALRYERGMNAPVCVAKGADLIARKIREVANQNGIPIVENPPLARAVYGTVEIDQEIRPEHYKAVAEVIGYVMRLNRSFAGRR